ncbi:CoA-binding protein [Nostocoides sp. F2B08]|uniref:CoA-binding protein n=1 Tax=Nostocoides sp. F2B08 TaxID=2653936 RepID=UPI0012636F2A|nr:CoA-binding protein [Tetrasphaera sp. F2B08]KAB7745680.1 CoA-binding protein [Tetrasphaera sp. F2B08]
MSRIADAAEEFLRCSRIAVTGVSRDPKGEAANGIYRRLRDRGYAVVAINPNATEVEGDPAYPDLASVPDGVEAVVIATRPEQAMGTVEDAIAAGVRQVWMHRAFGAGSVDAEAVRVGREAGLTVIDGGCPLMFGRASDGGHRFMCRLFTLTGKVPRTV